MFFGLFKKATTSHELATGLYHAVMHSDFAEMALKDLSDREILTKEERGYLLTARMYRLFEMKNLKKAQANLIMCFAVDNYGVNPDLLRNQGAKRSGPVSKDEEVLATRLVDIAIRIGEINQFFTNLSTTTDLIAKVTSLFGKEMDLIQRTDALMWYVSGQKIVDSVFQSAMKEFKIIDP